MRYKERHPTPHFKIPPPFNAVTGQYASLTGEIGVSPYCVLMQVAAEDTYADYVICRGFDTRMLVFVDYEAGNSNKPGISVAKPYGRRKAGFYQVGQICPALLPIQGNATYTPPSPAEIGLRLGQNPGTVAGTPELGGQPTDLNESLTLLYDHNGVAVNWLLMDSESKAVCDELDPDTYRGICGATIAPGETGPIEVYGGPECGVVQIDAENHSECTFRLGNRIAVTVDKCCEIWFNGCSCCGSDTPPDCCDRSAVICIGQVSKIVSFDGGSAIWDVSECCGCEGATFEVEITCVAEVPTADWTYTCGATVVTGSIDLSALCSDEPVEILDQLTVPCDGLLSDRWANYMGECDPCGLEPCVDGCGRIQAQQYLCVEQDCENPEYTSPFEYTLTADKQVICPGDTVTITCVYDPEDGYTGPVYAELTTPVGVITSYSPALGTGGFEIPNAISPTAIYWGDAAGLTFSITVLIPSAPIDCDDWGIGAEEGFVAGSHNDRHRVAYLGVECCP